MLLHCEHPWQSAFAQIHCRPLLFLRVCRRGNRPSPFLVCALQVTSYCRLPDVHAQQLASHHLQFLNILTQPLQTRWPQVLCASQLWQREAPGSCRHAPYIMSITGHLCALQVKKWATANLPSAVKPQMENYVVSRYIENPLLIGGKKFDLRVYVVVLNYKPLKVSSAGQKVAAAWHCQCLGCKAAPLYSPAGDCRHRVALRQG